MEYESIIKPPKSERLKSGRVTLKPGEDVGEHLTEEREELIVCLAGSATIIEGQRQTTIGPGETHYIPKNVQHNVRNGTEHDCTYIYIVALHSGSAPSHPGGQ